METRSIKAKRNIIAGVSYRLISMILPFLVRTAIIYIMGEQFVGLSGLFTSILQVLNMAELGFSSAIVYNMYRPIAQNDTDKVCALLSHYRKVYYCIGSIILVVGLLLLPFIPKLIHGSYPNEINIYILYTMYLINTVLSYFLFAYKNALLIALQRNDLISKIQSVLAIVQSIVQLSLLFLIKNFYVYVFILICTTVTSNFFVQYFSTKYFPQYSCRGEIEASLKKEIKKHVSGIMIEKLSDTSRNAFDSIIISSFIGLTSVTIYSNYYYIYSSIYALLLVITQAMAAGVGDSIVKETKQKNLHDMYEFQFIYVWIVTWCATCLLCLYQPFMKLWVGEKLMLPQIDMILFVLYFYIINMNNIRNLYFSGNGMWWRAKRYYILEALCNLILNVFLGYFLGITGVLIATILTMFIFNFLPRTLIVFKYYFGVSPKGFFKQHVLYFGTLIIVCSISFLVANVIPDENLLTLILKGLICLIVPNTLLLILTYKNKYFYVVPKYFKMIIRKNG